MDNFDAIETRWRHYAASFFEMAKLTDLSTKEISACLRYAEPLIRGSLPPIYSLENFSLLCGYSVKYLNGAMNGGGAYYRKFEIAKKSGGKRQIFEPLPSLKEIQRWILFNILSYAKTHKAAKAFLKGGSIRANARFHVGQRYLLTVDIKDFFPSIYFGDAKRAYSGLGYSESVSTFLSRLSTLSGTLPQGAPTSPALSNIICRPLDDELFSYARERGLRYTRYADDLSFSGEKITNTDIRWIYQALGRHNFRPNLKKTRVLRSHQRQTVTGLLVNDGVQVIKDVRRELRKHAYYIQKHGLDSHAERLGVERANFREHLLGKAGFVLWINKNDSGARNLKELLKGQSGSDEEVLG